MNAGRHIFDAGRDGVTLRVFYEDDPPRFRLELTTELGMTMMEWTSARHDPSDGLIADSDIDRILDAVMSMLCDIARGEP